MDKITYTFPADCPVAALRGVTATGGVLCRLDGKYANGEQPDAVKFDTRHDGKTLIAKIAGKPELEAVLAAHLAAEAAKAARLADMGWPQYLAVQRRAANARAAYDRASEYGFPARESAAAQQADAALEQARIDYPDAALYAQAEAWSWASNSAKSAAGRAAMQAIEQGEAPSQAVATMQAAWGGYCDQVAFRD